MASDERVAESIIVGGAFHGRTVPILADESQTRSKGFPVGFSLDLANEYRVCAFFLNDGNPIRVAEDGYCSADCKSHSFYIHESVSNDDADRMIRDWYRFFFGVESPFIVGYVG